MNEQNAVIRKVVIEIEDHGILTGTLWLDLDGSSQAFGGWNLESQPKWLRRVMETIGAKKWSDLTGMNLRIRGTFEKIKAIGHIVEDRWFEPGKDLKK